MRRGESDRIARRMRKEEPRVESKTNKGHLDVLDEVEDLVNTDYFSESLETKSPASEKVVANPSSVDMNIFKKTGERRITLQRPWRRSLRSNRTSSASGRGERSHNGGRRRRAGAARLGCSSTRSDRQLPRKMSTEINARHDTVVKSSSITSSSREV